MKQISASTVAIDAIFRVHDGWEPSLDAGRPVRCRWGAHDLSAVVESFDVVDDKLRIYLSEGSPGVLSEVLRQENDKNWPVVGECADGTMFESPRAYVGRSNSFHPPARTEIRLDALDWRIFHRTKAPQCWVARLDGCPPIERANLLITRTLRVGDSVTEIKTRDQIYLQGAKDYVLLRPRFAERPSHLVVLGNELPRYKVMYGELVALELATGQTLKLGRFYGIGDDGEAVAQASYTYGSVVLTNDTGPAVPLFSPSTWIAPFFACLSSKNRQDSGDLSIPISYYVASLSGIMENQLLSLCVALEAACHWNRPPDLEFKGETLAARVGPVYEAFNLTIPEGLLRQIQNARNKIVHTGAYTTTWDDSDVMAMLVVARAIRHLLVALLARLSGYDGELSAWPLLQMEDGTPLVSPFPRDWWAVGDGSRAQAGELFELKQEMAVEPSKTVT